MSPATNLTVPSEAFAWVADWRHATCACLRCPRDLWHRTWTSMSPKQPALGSLAVQAPSLTPQTVHVTPSTCQDLSTFKGEQSRLVALGFCLTVLAELMNQYRKLDDTITMRLNRSNAQFRDLDRNGLAGKGTVQDQACAHLWRELVGEPLLHTLRRHTLIPPR